MNSQKQKGVALVVGLVMLLVLTIMGVSSMSNTTIELKVACNYQTHNDAFQAANSAVEFAITQVGPGMATPLNLTYEMTDSNSTVGLIIDDLGCRQVNDNSLKFAAYEQIYSVDSRAVSTGCGGEAFSNIVQAVAVKRATGCAE